MPSDRHHPRQLIGSTDGVELVVHDLGGEGPPLLLAHATGFHGLVWQPLAARLATAYHCIAPDLRGHGGSTPPRDARFEWSGFADDVLAVVDTLELERPFGVGHSKGGAALLLAEQRRPGTFRALYLFEPILFPPDMMAFSEQAPNPMVEGALRRRDTFESFDAAYENFAAKPPFDSLDPEVLQAYVEWGFAEQPDGSVSLRCRPEHEAQVYRMGATHDAFANLDRVRCPVVVARGAMAPLGPPSFAAPIVDRLPAARLEAFDQLGHFGPLEDPAVLAQAITRAFEGA